MKYKITLITENDADISEEEASTQALEQLNKLAWENALDMLCGLTGSTRYNDRAHVEVELLER